MKKWGVGSMAEEILGYVVLTFTVVFTIVPTSTPFKI